MFYTIIYYTPYVCMYAERIYIRHTVGLYLVGMYAICVYAVCVCMHYACMPYACMPYACTAHACLPRHVLRIHVHVSMYAVQELFTKITTCNNLCGAMIRKDDQQQRDSVFNPQYWHFGNNQHSDIRMLAVQCLSRSRFTTFLTCNFPIEI